MKALLEALQPLLVPGGTLATVGAIVLALLKKFPPRATTLSQELAQVKAQAAQDMSDVRHDMRLLSDYVHDLREHIATGKPPPPPDWPEGMRL